MRKITLYLVCILTLSSQLISSTESACYQNLQNAQKPKKEHFEKEVRETNVNFLRNAMYRKIYDEEAKLEKYMNLLNDSENEFQSQRMQKKIKKTQKGINKLRNVLLGIELIK